MNKRKLSFLIAFVLLLSCCAGGCKDGGEAAAFDTVAAADVTQGEASAAVETEKDEQSGPVRFYPDSGIYQTESLTVRVETESPSRIFYTLDGSEPTEKSTPLTADGIKMEGFRTVRCYPLSIRAYYEDGEPSEIYVKSYLVGKIADSRFNTNIFSIVSEPSGLFDYDEGILVAGRLRDEYAAEHRGENIDPPAPANYNLRGIEAERACHVEIFTSDGQQMLSQFAGMRVVGGWSRAQKQKSLRLYARNEYDLRDKFTAALFSDALSQNGEPITKFKHLTLRNNANDSGSANVRDEFIQAVARDFGLQDTQSCAPVSVWLNGEYYGFMWLKETYDNEYFERHYGKTSGAFSILEGSERSKKADSDDENKVKAVSDFEEIYFDIGRKALTDELYAQLSARLDIENYLRYYAVQIYASNTDWPQNNHKIYRYFAADGEEYGEGVFDGRWRTLLFDTDFGFGLSGGVEVDSLGRVLDKTSGDAYSPLFARLMERDDAREYFVGLMFDLINGYFNIKYCSQTLTDLVVSRYNELEYHLISSPYSAGASVEGVSNNVTGVRNYIKARPDYMKSFTVMNLGLSGEFISVSIENKTDIAVEINGFSCKGDFEGEYPAEYNVTLTADGEAFKGWLINGETVEEASVTVNFDCGIELIK